MTREPFKLNGFGRVLAGTTNHTPGDGTPCETSWCPDGTITPDTARRPVNPRWWDEQEAHARRRIQAAEAALARYFDPDPLAAASNNWRHRDAAVHRTMDNANRALMWQEELRAARARLDWLDEHRP